MLNECVLQAMTFNFASGLICIVCALTLAVAMIDHCGNEFAFMFYISSAFGIIAGVLHLLNACVCNVYIPLGEWYLLINGLSGKYRFPKYLS